MPESEFRTAERFLTVEQFAESRQLCTATVYRLVRAGEIPAEHIGRSIRIPESANAEPE
jgi:excisionase family DNA binding protein